MEERKREEFQEEELDLYELFLKIRKRWKVVALSFSLFLLGSLLYILTARPVYETNFILKINNLTLKEIRAPVLTPKDVSEIINRIDLSVENLVSVKALPQRNVRDSVLVKMEAYTTKALKEAYEELIRRIKDYPTVSRLRKDAEILIRGKLEELRRNLSAMEKKKAIVEKRILSGEEVYFDPLSMDRNLMAVRNEIRRLEVLVNRISVIDVVVEPRFAEEPSKPKKGLILSTAGVSGLFLGVFLALLAEYIQSVRKERES
ncbi:MAG: Wzz/FepE/Etk N-terminal domain-containing protein [Aquificota bacterium]|nr:Wzz/FepE/Etk N-terminal domain-containing protein [Aquificota bacterium]